MRIVRLALVAGILLATPGCTAIAAWTAGVAQNLSSSTPSQVTTYADAVVVVDAFTKTADAYVQTGKATPTQLDAIDAISDKVHDAFTKLKAANAAGQSLDFAALNAALALWSSYTTQQGIAH